ncbi:MAG: hypothetical protein LBS80_05440 [Tannerella sp.]|jgi:hypothetical protein|nr:hypothetical protein [Tannerella sp.]
MRTIYFVSLGLIIAATALGQSPEKIFAWLPEVASWKKPADKEVFDPENLFDRINGSAPLFLENGFREMTTFDYTQGEDYISIQVYRHASPEDAFGMYSSERSTDLAFYDNIGGEGHGDQGSFFFFADSLYVKIHSSKATDATAQAMQLIAQTIASKAVPKASYPPLFRSFPKDGKIPYTEAFITSNYIGHEFLKKVYVSQYKQGDVVFQLFVIDAGTSEAAKEILNQYFKFTKQTETFKEGELLVKDRFNGDIPLRWQGRYIIGIYNENGQTIPKAQEILGNCKF